MTGEWDPTNFTMRPFPRGPKVQVFARDPDHPERVVSRFDAAWGMVWAVIEADYPEVGELTPETDKDYVDNTPLVADLVKKIKASSDAPGEYKVGADCLAELLHLGLLRKDETLYEACIHIGPLPEMMQGRR